MISIDDYYLGIILPSLTYYQNPKRIRKFYGESYDPFEDMPQILALLTGVDTLLYKKNDVFYDEYFSRYRHEIAYKEREENKLGIVLAYARPFRDYYKEEPVTYLYEDVANNYDKQEELLENHSYYIAHSKEKNKDTVVVLDEEPIKVFKKDYWHHLNQK